MDAFWNLITIPMLNLLLLLYEILGHNFALSIAVFTILVRVVTLPLTLPQQRSAKAMQTLQPQIQELQKKYKNDREKLSQAQMELYKEAGVNPLGGCLPMLIQFPVWIGLYQAIIRGLGNSPMQLFQLSQSIFPALRWLSDLVPLNATFLWMDLAHPDRYYVLPILVAVSTYVQQKMMATPSNDPQTASMNQMMTLMMPLMFGYFSLQFASGLSLYWVVSSLVGIITQYFQTGWGNLLPQRSSRNAV
ncbi:MAG: hypothetical protein A2Z04_04935, partial [Chloroflexi bacterium RBG_16_57_9]